MEKGSGEPEDSRLNVVTVVSPVAFISTALFWVVVIASEPLVAVGHILEPDTRKADAHIAHLDAALTGRKTSDELLVGLCPSMHVSDHDYGIRFVI